MNTRYSLSQLPPGACGRIHSLSGAEAMVRRLEDLGLIEGTQVCCAFRAPSGDPAAYFFRGSLIAIRNTDAERIFLEGAIL